LPDELQLRRRILILAIEDVTEAADQMRRAGLDYQAITADATRMLNRLIILQIEIERRDLD
jgi:hypothetical protein